MPTITKSKSKPQVTPLSLPGERLTAQQKLFIIEFAKDGDRVRAAIACGVPEKRATALSHRWLHDPNYAHIAQAAREAFEEKRRNCQIEAKQIVQELAKIAFLNPKHAVNDDDTPRSLREMPDEVAAGIKKFRTSYKLGLGPDGAPCKVKTTEIEFWSKPDALKQLAQHLGLLKDVININQMITLDWGQLMGRKPVENLQAEEDPIEARIRAAKGTPPALPAPQMVNVGADGVVEPPELPGHNPCALKELPEEEVDNG